MPPTSCCPQHRGRQDQLWDRMLAVRYGRVSRGGSCEWDWPTDGTPFAGGTFLNGGGGHAGWEFKERCHVHVLEWCSHRIASSLPFDATGRNFELGEDWCTAWCIQSLAMRRGWLNGRSMRWTAVICIGSAFFHRLHGKPKPRAPWRTRGWRSIFRRHVKNLWRKHGAELGEPGLQGSVPEDGTDRLWWVSANDMQSDGLTKQMVWPSIRDLCECGAWKLTQPSILAGTPMADVTTQDFLKKMGVKISSFTHVHVLFCLICMYSLPPTCWLNYSTGALWVEATKEFRCDCVYVAILQKHYFPCRW